MQRRRILQTGLAASVAGTVNVNAALVADSPRYYELRAYELRNDQQPQRLLEFVQQHGLPALKRQGVTTVGCFQGQTGMPRPGLLLVTEYKSLAELQSVQERLRDDKAWMQAVQAFEGAGEPPYVRYDTTLLRAFDQHPQCEIPAPLTDKDGKPVGRVFELRTYESRSTVSLRNKVEMFNQEEIAIFRACGFAPVFFGATVVGGRMPSLTYMVGFDTMEARDKAWAKFVAHPDFNRIKVKPGWTDAEAVSTIHAAFVRPTAFSAIR